MVQRPAEPIEATLADMPRIAERALREWGHIIERERAEEMATRFDWHPAAAMCSLASVVKG